MNDFERITRKVFYKFRNDLYYNFKTNTEAYLMRITSTDIQIFHHIKLLRLRNQERIVQSQQFADLWNNADKVERKRILFLLRKVEPDKLKELLTKHNDLSTIEIRKVASYYRIKNYSRKTKAQLLIEIDYAKSRCQK